MEFDARFDAVEKTVKQAGNMLAKGFEELEQGQIREKAPGDFVTVYDVKSERRLVDQIEEQFPTHGIFSEEKGKEGMDKEYVWVIDPLDGTTNFTTKNPFFNISVALTRDTDEGRVPIFAVVYAPITDELFRAEKGNGATRNRESIAVSERSDLDSAFVAFCVGYEEDARARGASIYKRMRTRTGSLRQVGAAALELSYVACGRFDAFYMNDMNPWDVMAGALLVQEAGGTVTDFQNETFTIDSQDILATNGAIHEALREELQHADPA